MEKTIRITIDSKYGHHEVFESRGILGAFVGEEHSDGRSDTSQFLLGEINDRELTKMLSGIINNLYIAKGDTPVVKLMVLMALEAAHKKFQEDEKDIFKWT